MAGKGNPRTGGRAPGTPNKITSDLRELMNSILMDDPKVTREKLEALRDSDEPTDRKTFWTLAGKMLPQVIEGKVESDLPLLVLEQNYVAGTTTEREMTPDEQPESMGEERREWEE